PLPSFRMAPRTSRPGDGSGPALLVEMARAWPKPWSERFEPLLVAAGGMNFGFAGVREMVRLIREEGNEKPTLVVVILAPGVGQELTIRGRPKALPRLAGLEQVVRSHRADGGLVPGHEAAARRPRRPRTSGPTRRGDRAAMGQATQPAGRLYLTQP